MDDTSLSAWLHLREQADWSARSAALTRAVAARLPSDQPVGVLDLGTGAGSNLRYLIERLPDRQHWLVSDRSAALLSDVIVRTREWAAARGYTVRAAGPGLKLRGERLDCRIETRTIDLAQLDDDAMFEGRHLVTASALLDLVSESWLRTLASRCRAAGAAVLLTISYDGRSTCDPPEPEDERVRDLLNAHQERDKGLGGPAQGPAAVAAAERCLTREGFRVQTAASDWVLGAQDAALQRSLIDGWAEAAVEMAPDEAETIASWRSRRLAHVDAERSQIVVGHRDLAAWRD